MPEPSGVAVVDQARWYADPVRMSVRVQHGILEVKPDGIASDTLWVTDFKNRKLNNSAAASLGSRLEDFLIMCGTQTAELHQMIVRGEPSAHKPGFLLELATAMTGVGVSIHEAIIQGGPDAPPRAAVAEPEYDFKHGRYFRFMLKGATGGKMDADRVASLIFTLRLLQGKATMPTVAPNMDALLHHGG
ncbi:hypothetical protein TSOC_005427 [Tetrabaena socialis]|uniref:Uncharacterized protein n=1 Tax=Tetrabaena socialis TaxID=47790 RepID=A0A2J8A697_9CHLO|nr:hypothetical protein TSOC_005427 [Tetrabaena socialis]|eukprot:PNH08048.1 hypothetical protein TSOC_005427 [Tetrabaena socialis]